MNIKTNAQQLFQAAKLWGEIPGSPKQGVSEEHADKFVAQEILVARQLDNCPADSNREMGKIELQQGDEKIRTELHGDLTEGGSLETTASRKNLDFYWYQSIEPGGDARAVGVAAHPGGEVACAFVFESQAGHSHYQIAGDAGLMARDKSSSTVQNYLVDARHNELRQTTRELLEAFADYQVSQPRR